MEATLTYNSNKIKINITNINSLDNLTKEIKDILKIDSTKEIDIYTRPGNTYLNPNNFKDEFLEKKLSIKEISVQDVEDLAEKIKNIGLDDNFVPINKIQEDLDFSDNAKSIILDKHQIFKDNCSLCKKMFNHFKYGCLLCPDYFLCTECEENHPHPMIKFKSNILSDNIKKIILINSTFEKNNKDLQELAKKKLGVKKVNPVLLRTNISSNTFMMGPNQERMLSLLIKNGNKFLIPKNSLTILIKNQFDLNVTVKDEVLFNDFGPGFEVPITLYIRSNSKNLFENYNLKIEVVSNSLDIISTPIELKIAVKSDEEDDALNKNFEEFPSIILLPKDKKKKLQYIIKEKLSVKSPQEIKAIMEKFKWSIDQAINDLTN